jgi:antitoxin MazE
MRSKLRKIGGSMGIVIPKALLAQISASPDGHLEMTLENGRICLAPTKRKPREGWAVASRAIAAAEDDGLVWSEFRNADD